MREIKFRAWSHRKNKMVWAHMDGEAHCSAWVFTCYEANKGVEPNDMILMQYTGLKDKNGVEIYEGDIVIADYHWEKPHAIELPEDYYWFDEAALDDGDMEAIGNIYENPELRG